MNRVALLAAAVAAIAAMWMRAPRADDDRFERQFGAGSSRPALSVPASGGGAVAAGRVGFPSMHGLREDRSWAGLVWAQIGARAALDAGAALDDESRVRFLRSLSRLRDAEARRDRARGKEDPDDRIEAARRQREAALAADEVSRELFGVPLGVFLSRISGTVEEVPKG